MENDEDNFVETESGRSRIVDYYWIVRERWLIGALAGLLLAGFFVLYGFRRTPEYTTSLQMLVTVAQDNVLDMQQVVDEVSRSSKSEPRLKQHLIELQSRKFRDYVVTSLNDTEVSRILMPYRSAELPTPNIDAVLQTAVAIGLNARDMVYTISATHRDPKMAADIANRYALKYIEYTFTDVSHSNASALSFLRQNAEKMQQAILEDKRTLQRFREENGIISVDENRRIAIDKIVNLNGHRSGFIAEKRKHEAVLEQLHSRDIERGGLADDRIGRFFEIEEVGSFGYIRQIKNDLDAAMTTQKEIDLVYLDRHPKYIENRQRISDLRTRLKAEVILAFSSLLASVAQLDAQLEKNAADLAALHAETQRLDELGIVYRRLETKIGDNESMLKRIEERLNETTISTQLSKANIRVIDPALEPTVPSSPNRKKTLITAVFLFVIGMIGVPIAISRFDNKLKSPWDVESFVGKPLLGEIVPLRKEQVANMPFLVSEGKDAPIVDAFRSIYSTVKLNTSNTDRKIQVVTSTIPDEGKTMFCLNYAAVIAQHGKRVLLMDCDLRKPQIQQYLGLKRSVGLVGWFNEGSELAVSDEVPETLGIQELASGVHLLPAGSSTNRSTELVESDRFRALLTRLSNKFDHIIIDSPPLGVFPDAMFLADYAQELIYIVRCNKVSRQAVRSFIERLDKTAAHVCGIVITRRTQSSRGRYYGYNNGNAKYYKRYAAAEEAQAKQR